MRYILEKSCKNYRSVVGSAPKLRWPLEAEATSQTPCLLLLYAVTIFYRHIILPQNALLLSKKNNMRLFFTWGAKILFALGRRVP